MPTGSTPYSFLLRHERVLENSALSQKLHRRCLKNKKVGPAILANNKLSPY